MTPIIIANPSPFRLIARGGNDKWCVKIYDINNGTYNYLKLHRSTKGINADIVKPFPLILGFDGSFILPACREYADLDIVLDEFNRIFASILIGGTYIKSVTLAELARGEMSMEGYYRHTVSYGANSELHMSLGNRDGSSNDAMNLLEPEIISWESIDEAYKQGTKVLSAIPNLSPSLFITGFSYYVEHQLRESLSHTWISIEQVIESIWDQVVVNDESLEGIPGRKRQLESQQWSVSHKAEVLLQKQIFSKDIYSNLTLARKERNKFIHKGERPSSEIVRSALLGLCDLLVVAASLREVYFNKENLTKYLKVEKESAPQNFMVAKSEDVDWSKVSYWKLVLPIPGDTQWQGEFESFDDIKLQKLK